MVGDMVSTDGGAMEKVYEEEREMVVWMVRYRS